MKLIHSTLATPMLGNAKAIEKWWGRDVSVERDRNTILSKNVELNHTCTILMTIRDCLLLKLRSDGYTLVQQKKIKTVDVSKQSEKYVIEAVCTNHGSSH